MNSAHGKEKRRPSDSNATQIPRLVLRMRYPEWLGIVNVEAKLELSFSLQSHLDNMTVIANQNPRVMKTSKRCSHYE
jgi:hypothetical protein